MQANDLAPAPPGADVVPAPPLAAACRVDESMLELSGVDREDVGAGVGLGPSPIAHANGGGSSSQRLRETSGNGGEVDSRAAEGNPSEGLPSSGHPPPPASLVVGSGEGEGASGRIPAPGGGLGQVRGVTVFDKGCLVLFFGVGVGVGLVFYCLAWFGAQALARRRAAQHSPPAVH
jgi:hypothetical protein